MLQALMSYILMHQEALTGLSVLRRSMTVMTLMKKKRRRKGRRRNSEFERKMLGN